MTTHRDLININMSRNGMPGGGDWIGLAQNRDTWRAVLNAVMDLRVHEARGIYFHYLKNCKVLQKDSASWSYGKSVPVIAILLDSYEQT